MSTATVATPAGQARAKPAGQAKAKRTPPTTAGKKVNKRTITEYREALLEKKAKILQQVAVRVGKLDKKIAEIDMKHASRIAAAEAIKAAKAEGKSVQDLNEDLTAKIKELMAQRRFINKV